MGRRRIDIRPIQGDKNRQTTFVKRKNGLLKKAMELSVLCNADIAIVIFNEQGKLTTFSSKDMKDILSKYSHYNGYLDSRCNEFYTKKKTPMAIDMKMDEPALFAIVTEAAQSVIAMKSLNNKENTSNKRPWGEKDEENVDHDEDESTCLSSSGESITKKARTTSPCRNNGSDFIKLESDISTKTGNAVVHPMTNISVTDGVSTSASAGEIIARKVYQEAVPNLGSVQNEYEKLEILLRHSGEKISESPISKEYANKDFKTCEIFRVNTRACSNRNNQINTRVSIEQSAPVPEIELMQRNIQLHQLFDVRDNTNSSGKNPADLKVFSSVNEVHKLYSTSKVDEDTQIECWDDLKETRNHPNVYLRFQPVNLRGNESSRDVLQSPTLSYQANSKRLINLILTPRHCGGESLQVSPKGDDIPSIPRIFG